MNKREWQDNKNILGFTLIELMVAIAIVAILATVGVTVFSSTQKNSRDARRKADIQAISQALEGRYNSSQNQYCGNGTGGIAAGTNAAVGTYCPPQVAWFAGGGLPVDPQNTTPNIYTAWDQAVATPPNLNIWTSAAWAKYTVCAKLENAGTGNAADTKGGQTGSKDYYCLSNNQS